MKFKITLSPQEYFGYVVSITGKTCGLAVLDRVRQETGVPGLKPGRVSDTVQGLCANSIVVEITEDAARQSGHFVETTSTKVLVPEGYLNKFSYEHLVVEKNNETGEIVSAEYERRVDHEAILESWRRAGFPLEWGFDESEN